MPGPALPWLSLPLEAGVQAASGPRGMPPEEPSSQVWVRKPRAGSDLRALGQHPGVRQTDPSDGRRKGTYLTKE